MTKPSKIVPRLIVDTNLPPLPEVPDEAGRGDAKSKRHMGRIAQMSCVLCARLGMMQAGPTFVHHIREGQGKSQRASNWLTIPLCYVCHQGTEGVHGNRALLRVANCGELWRAGSAGRRDCEAGIMTTWHRMSPYHLENDTGWRIAKIVSGDQVSYELWEARGWGDAICHARETSAELCKVKFEEMKSANLV